MAVANPIEFFEDVQYLGNPTLDGCKWNRRRRTMSALL
jgi:hypothetical protein